jgi:hypothetical protein
MPKTSLTTLKGTCHSHEALVLLMMNLAMTIISMQDASDFRVSSFLKNSAQKMISRDELPFPDVESRDFVPTLMSRCLVQEVVVVETQ